MSKHVSRRAALAAGVTAATGLLGCSRRDSDEGGGGAFDPSWVGKTVLPKKPDPAAVATVTPPPEKLPPVEEKGNLRGASWVVKAEKGTRVEVIENGMAGWVEKELLVLLADAIEFFTQAIRENEKDAYAYNFRGWAKYLLGKPDDAIKDFDEFLKLSPVADMQRAIGLSNRGLVFAEMGKFEMALKDLDEAVMLGFLPATANRGWAHELKGDYKKAMDDFGRFDLRLDNAHVLNNLAWLRSTCPDAAFRDGKEAVKLAKRVCELSGNREGMYLDTLAAAHAEAGDFPAAVKAQELALEDKGYVRKYGDDAQKRLQLYKDKKPYRSEPLK